MVTLKSEGFEASSNCRTSMIQLALFHSNFIVNHSTKLLLFFFFKKNLSHEATKITYDIEVRLLQIWNKITMKCYCGKLIILQSSDTSFLCKFRYHSFLSSAYYSKCHQEWERCNWFGSAEIKMLNGSICCICGQACFQ